MKEDLALVWNQMRSDFEAVMLAFSTQRNALQKQDKTMEHHVQESHRAMEEQRRAMEEQQRAMEEQQRAMAELRQAAREQREATEAQGAALRRYQDGFVRLVELVDGYYQNHEQRLCALEGRITS